MSIDKINHLILAMEVNQKKPIWDVYHQIRSLTLSFYVFQANYEQMKLINISSDDALDLHAPDNQEQFESASREAIRLFHNFLASAKTLVDHTRNTVKRLYSGTSFMATYEAQKDDLLVNNPIQVFVQDLRNYAQHYTLPIIESDLSFHRDHGLSHKWTLNIKDFSPNYNWKNISIKFMEKYEYENKQIPLEQLSCDYFNIIKDFYQWFGDKQQEFHGEAIKEAASEYN